MCTVFAGHVGASRGNRPRRRAGSISGGKAKTQGKAHYYDIARPWRRFPRSSAIVAGAAALLAGLQGQGIARYGMHCFRLQFVFAKTAFCMRLDCKWFSSGLDLYVFAAEICIPPAEICIFLRLKFVFPRLKFVRQGHSEYRVRRWSGSVWSLLRTRCVKKIDTLRDAI